MEPAIAPSPPPTPSAAPDSALQPFSPSAPLPIHASALADLGWTHTATIPLPARAAVLAANSDLPALTPAATHLLAKGRPLYRHQALALADVKNGSNVVLATGTGSGKTRVFHLAAADQLNGAAGSLILALYPNKALAREQADLWRGALADAGFSSSEAVALITGDLVDKQRRLSVLRRASVLVLTPDTLHAWLLGHLSQPHIRTALRRLRLVVVDEAHTLSGVFGSNTLWLFRRLQSLLASLDSPPIRWLAASGTLANPAAHLALLTGQPFVAIEEKDDGSPRHLRRLHLIRPAEGKPLSTGLGQWLQQCAQAAEPASRFVVFAQSRVQTESLSSLANRLTNPAASAPLARIAPYRAGLSAEERADLQDRFARGFLRGLVSTSAFELGLDLPGLCLGFLVGLPESPASFWQRLGRFGRHAEADIFLIDDGTERTARAFANPDQLPRWVARDAALYPDNPILIARHVLCHDQERRDLGLPAALLSKPSDLPALTGAFNAAHAALLRGEPTPALRDAFQQQANTQPPHLAFPLRSVEPTYTFKPALASHRAPEGFVTYAQVLREAYPGAVYYHNGQPWRVVRLNARQRTLTVTEERHYHTKPAAIPPAFIPDLSQPAFADLRWPGASLRAIETVGRATESITGFTESRGGQSAPGGDYRNGAFGVNSALYRAYETTGVILASTHLEGDVVRRDLLAAALRDALLDVCPREAAEIAASSGRLRADRRDLMTGTRYVALYDTVPGSLRLSSALADPASLPAILERTAMLLAERSHGGSPTDVATVAAARALASATRTTPSFVPLDWPDASPALAFAPGTVALHRRSQLAVLIDRVVTDLDGNVVYHIRRTDDPSFQGQVQAHALAEIPELSVSRPLSEVLAETPSA